jgi:Tfp pilus assembly protein PilX
MTRLRMPGRAMVAVLHGSFAMRMAQRGRRRRGGRGERGAVLLVVLLVMLTLLGLGVMTLWLTSANLQVGSTVNQRTQALYVAEAGLERARAVLNAPTAPVLNTLLLGATPGYDDVPTGLDANGYPNGVGAILRDGATSLRNIAFPPASFARSSGTADNPIGATMGTYTVWIRNDLAELRQNFYAADGGNNTVTIRARGVAADGRTNVVLEATMVPSGAAIPTPGTATAGLGNDCVSGKNACDDNSSTQYGITYGN